MGSLGEWVKGKMAKPFDDVVFNPDTPLKKVVGPVQTQFGFHLIRVTMRETDEMLQHRRSMAKIYARKEF